MAKGQTSFADKARKAAEKKAEAKPVLVIQSIKDPRTGATKFANRIVSVPLDSNMDNYLKEIVESKG
jgi:hypothetical protein